MEEKAVTSIAQILFQYGPFAILAYLLINIIQLTKQMRTASREIRNVLKRNILIYQIIIAALVVVCVVYWVYYYSGPKYYYGEIKGIDQNEYEIKSPDLFINTLWSGGEYKIQWVWKKDKDSPDATINFIKGIASNPAKTFYLYSEKLKKGYCRLIYSKEDGWLKYLDEKLPIKPKALISIRKADIGSGFLFADQLGVEVDKDIDKTVNQILNQLQAVDFNVRYQAIEKFLKEASDPVKKKVISRGFDILNKIKQLNSNPDAMFNIYNATYLFSSLLAIISDHTQTDKYKFKDWENLFGIEGFNLIVEAAGNNDPDISNLSLKYMMNYKAYLYPMIDANIKDERYQQNSSYLKGGINFISKISGQLSTLQDYANRQSILQNPELESRVQSSIKALKLQQNVQALETTSKQLKAVIDLAFKLKENNTNYKWGGKNEKEGFDSSGFIAYILSKAKVLNNPDKYWSQELRNKIGEKIDDKNPNVGDLIFYDGGVVMLYLGNDLVIGMTEEGITIREYRTYSSGPLQINRVKYR